MRTHFPQYYRVQRKHLKDQFKKLVFVLDTSALLDIFRLDKATTSQVFDVLKRYSGQIVIPYHVAEEYNGKIHSVLLGQLHKIDDAQRAFDSFVQVLEVKRNQPYISSLSAHRIQLLKKSIKSDFDTQRSYLWEQLLHGELQNMMCELMEGRVLEPFTEEELKEIAEEGKLRYEKKIPPGWKDDSKGDNGYGDLINWKEILRYAKSNKKSVVFISNDQKEDWICQHEGRIVCPHYELLKEFYDAVEDNSLLFHIFTLDRFLDFVREQDNSAVSETTIEQVRGVLGDGKLLENIQAMSNFYESLAAIKANNEKLSSIVSVYSKIGRHPLYSPLSQEEIGVLLKEENNNEEKIQDSMTSESQEKSDESAESIIKESMDKDGDVDSNKEG